MKFLIELRTTKKRYSLFGMVFEWKQPVPEYLEERTRTTVALIPPQRTKEGYAFKLWGYDRYAPKSNVGDSHK